jgi:regulator of extracellular matrix RemA (YlzA/DUF370 family)
MNKPKIPRPADAEKKPRKSAKHRKLLRGNRIQHANYINSMRVIAMSTYDNKFIQEQLETARDNGNLIDLTNGQKPVHVFFMDSGKIILTHTMI